MKSSEKHLSRSQLIAAAAGGHSRSEAHVKDCDECREFYELLQRFGSAGDMELVAPSNDAVERWVNAPLLDTPELSRRLKTGHLAFDSWSERMAVVRDIPDGLVRRLRLQAGDLALELVGERRKLMWHFVARVYRDDRVETGFSVRAGRVRVVPGEDGFIMWSAARPPRRLALLSPEEQIQFEALSW